ncbi:unnamed protein product [Gadus morhua 'NCC']
MKSEDVSSPEKRFTPSQVLTSEHLHKIVVASRAMNEMSRGHGNTATIQHHTFFSSRRSHMISFNTGTTHRRVTPHSGRSARGGVTAFAAWRGREFDTYGEEQQRPHIGHYLRKESTRPDGSTSSRGYPFAHSYHPIQ